MNGHEMTSDELEKFKKRHQRHAEIELVDYQLQISLKNSERKIVEIISLTLNEDMTLYPLQAVDEIITAFQLDTYMVKKTTMKTRPREFKPRDKPLEEIEYALMGLFAKARQLLETTPIPYRLASISLKEPENEIQQIQLIVLASLIFLYGKSRAEVEENMEDYKEKFIQLLDLCNNIAADISILKEVVKGTVEFSNDMKTIRLRNNEVNHNNNS